MVPVATRFLVIAFSAFLGLGTTAGAAPPEDTFVAPPETTVTTPAVDVPAQAWRTPIVYGAGSRNDEFAIRERGGNPFFNSVASFAHVFAAFDVRTAHRLLPKFVRRRRVEPQLPPMLSSF